MSDRREPDNENAWHSWWWHSARYAELVKQPGQAAYASDVIEQLAASGVPAPTGRKVAAVIYEDELPQITAGKTVLDVYVDTAPMALLGVEQHLSMARSHIARMRQIEARDAAAKDQERVEEERVENRAAELYGVWHAEQNRPGRSLHAPMWAVANEQNKDGWRAVARFELAVRELGTR